MDFIGCILVKKFSKNDFERQREAVAAEFEWNCCGVSSLTSFVIKTKIDFLHSFGLGSSLS